MPFPKQLTGFNRRIANPLMRQLAHRLPGMGIVLHRGRTSGTPYRTPVLAFQDDDAMTFALTYGPDVDWLKNVLNTGGCSFVQRGQTTWLTDPRLIDSGEGMSRMPPAIRFILQRAGVSDFLEMRREQANGKKRGTMSQHPGWQLDDDGARNYLRLADFILGPAADALIDWLDLDAGQNILDVGCGPAVATLRIVRRTNAPEQIIGVDNNAGMIQAAREVAPDIEFTVADAATLPFEDGSFDFVLSAQTIQFLPDQPAAITDMARVLKPGGTLALSTWADVTRSPHFDALLTVSTKYFGADVAGKFGAAFSLPSRDAVEGLLTQAGLHAVTTRTVTLHLTFDRLDQFIPLHFAATPLAGAFADASETIQRAIVKEIQARLERYIGDDGRPTVPVQVNLARGSRPVDLPA